MSGASTAARWIGARWALVLPAFAYLYLFPYLPDLRSPNELCRLHQTRALVDHGSFEITRVLAEAGWVGDLSCVAIARGGDGAVVERRACPAVGSDPRFGERHYYPSKAPLLSVAAAPVYAALAWFGGRPVPELALVFFARLFCTLLPAALLLVLLRRFLRASLPPAHADALTAAYALGTLAFSYASLFMSHQTAAVLLFACFYALWRLARREWHPRGYGLAGLLAGLAMAAEYTAALGLVPLAAYALARAGDGWRGRTRAAAWAILGALPAVALLALYHQTAFGHPLHSGYKYLNDAAYQGWHVGGFLGIKLPQPRALLLSFFSPLRGLFALSPMLALALLGFRRRAWARERRAELGLSLGLVALYTYFTSSFSYDSWGWTTGPRHLTPLVPFLMLPLGLALGLASKRRWAAGIAAGSIVFSMLATSVMTFLDYIPDSLTDALHQVALPFALKGLLPHSWLSLLGVPNPWAAAPALLAIAGATLLAARAALAPEPADARGPAQPQAAGPAPASTAQPQQTASAPIASTAQPQRTASAALASAKPQQTASAAIASGAEPRGTERSLEAPAPAAQTAPAPSPLPEAQPVSNRAGWAAAAATVAALAALHAAAQPRTESARRRDEGTFRFLEERYTPRPGAASPALWDRAR